MRSIIDLYLYTTLYVLNVSNKIFPFEMSFITSYTVIQVLLQAILFVTDIIFRSQQLSFTTHFCTTGLYHVTLLNTYVIITRYLFPLFIFCCRQNFKPKWNMSQPARFRNGFLSFSCLHSLFYEMLRIPEDPRQTLDLQRKNNLVLLQLHV